MRIIHDIDHEPEVSGSGRLYGVPITDRSAGASRASGFRASLIVAAGPMVTSPHEETIYIEGDARHVRKALVDALRVLDATAESFVQEAKLDTNWAGAPAGKEEGA